MGLDATEKQRRRLDQLKGKGHFAEEITADDTSNLPDVNAQLFIGTGGNIKVTLSGGSTVVLKNIPSGTFLKGVYVDKIFRTGTTARDIVGIY
tara:strand:- start:20308 stop:20586 length:279 start_codon:yes stop_codon:yes gene_type:complete